MLDNPITDEIRRIRHELAERCGNDVYRIGEEIRERQAKSGRKYVRLPKREPIDVTLGPRKKPVADQSRATS